MSNRSIGKVAGKTSNFSVNFESVTFNSIRKVLPDKTILDACRQANYSHRNRFITPVLTVLYMILTGIWPEESFVASWQLLWASFAANFPSMAGQSPSRGTVSNARKRLPLEVWHKIVAWLSEQGQTYSEKMDKWQGHRVVAVDGTCMTVPNTNELCDTFGLSRGNCGRRIYPLVRMVCLSVVETMIVINYRLGGYKTDENKLLKPMLKMLRKGDLLLADRHFAGANLYWLYMTNGLEYLTWAHQRLIVSRLKRLWSYGANDVDITRISFIHTIRAIIAFAPALAMQLAEQLPMIYRAMLCEIAAHLVPLRPGRLEPRKLAHDPKHYPRLKTTRAQWRKQNAA
jgi:hypothetical protein